MAKAKGKYVDGFVLAVPKKNMATYARMAREGGRMWKKFGALEYKECVGDDLNPNMGGVPFLKFGKMLKLKPGETAVFSYIVYKSRAHRDAVNKKIMADMKKYEKEHGKMQMPFDTKRMAYGGFRVIVDPFA